MTSETLENPRNVGRLWDNKSGPRGAGNTAEGLTHSLDLGKEGLPMNGTRTCSVDGCDRPAIRRGWCNPHSQRWRKHGDVLAHIPIKAKVSTYAGEDCAVEDCPAPARRRGWCAMHYMRWYTHGDVSVARAQRDDDDPTGARRLADNVLLDGECLRWKGSRNWGGYGQISVGGRQQRVHRVAYELAKGPIPEGLEIDHLCRVRDCINPDHLEAVTHQENIRRVYERKDTTL